MDALKDLHREGISLAGVDISKAHLLELKLENAYLRDANFAGAILPRANLSGAELWSANLSGADLREANLTGAYIGEANLTEADLRDANLTGAALPRSNLRDIKNWQRIQSIELAIIYDVDNPPDGFIEWATEHGAVIIKDEEEWKRLLREKEQEKTKEK